MLEGPVPRAAVVVADGLFDISYGPTDVVLLDGNVPHGITNLRELPSGPLWGQCWWGCPQGA